MTPDYRHSAILAGWEPFIRRNGDTFAEWFMSPDDNDDVYPSAEEVCRRFGVPLEPAEPRP